MTQEPVISWKTAGILLGLLLTFATYAYKPLGVSTQYVVTDGIIAHKIAPEKAEQNEYFQAKVGKDNWQVGSGWMLVFGMFIGGGIAAFSTRRFHPKDESEIPSMWAAKFGNSKGKRWFYAFIGGVLLLFGARLAGGCTSGHMISGISQLAISSLIFGVAIFASGIFTAKMLYRNK